jgi:tetratricopeptide (TPR) repeat protein
MPTSTQRLVRLLRTSAVRRLLRACFVRFLRAFGTQRDARWLSYRAGQELTRSHWRAAIDYAELAIAADPTWADGHRLLGRAFLGAGDAAGVRRAYEAGARLAPDDFNHAWAAGNRGLTPDDAQALANLGIGRYVQGELPSAVSFLAAAIECDSAHPRAHYYLARALADLGWPEEGLATASRAVGLAPDDQRPRALLAQLARVVDPFGQRARGP